MAAKRAAPGPLASIGTRRPRPGTGAIIATSANGTPASPASSANCRLVPGEAVFKSAHRTSGRAPSSWPRAASPASPALNASTAAFALLTLSTRCAPRAAWASLVVSMMGSAAVTAGS